MLCEAVCGIQVEVDGNRVTGVRGDPLDPFSQGHICPKASALQDMHDDPDRIRQPLRRVGSSWQPVSWESALAEAGERLAQVQAQHGRSAVALYYGNPTVHSYSAMLAVPLFAKAMGTRARFSATSVDQLPQMLVALKMFGNQLLLPIPDIDRTSFLLIFGANPVVSNGSLMTAPNVAHRLKEIRRRGGKMVVIDPRRTETAALADAHHFIRPGADALLLLAMLHTIFEEKLESLGALASFTDGLSTLTNVARSFPPQRVAERVGINADAIRGLARDFAKAPAAVCYGRVGVCTQDYGGLASWLVVALNVVTGNLDRPGGAMFTNPAVDVVGLGRRSGQKGHFDLWKSRVRKLPEFGGELPVAALAEEMETPGEGQLRALVTFAGNPVLSAPNGPRIDAALAKLDFMVAIDIYKNETTRHANLILPTSFGLERDHYDLAFYALSVRNAARYAKAIVKPPAGVRHDWEVLLDLALQVNANGGGKQRRSLTATVHAMRRIGPRRVLDMLLRFGPHGGGLLGRKGLSLAALEKEPHGIDLGALVPSLPKRLQTPDRRIALAPEIFVADIARLEKDLGGAGSVPARDELMLIGRRLLRSNNSWMHNSLRLVKGREQCTLLMHPEDAHARGLKSGDSVRIASRVGALLAPLQVSDGIARGVVSLPHGFGHTRPGTSMSVAESHAGVSINDLTDEQALDTLTGNASFSGVRVTVRTAAADA